MISKKLLGILIAAIATGTFSTASIAGCFVPIVRFCTTDCSQAIKIRATPGSVCAFQWYANTLDRLIDNKVVLKPKQGILGVANASLVAYRPREDAQGSDYFEFDSTYQMRGGQSVTDRFKVDVTIVR